MEKKIGDNCLTKKWIEYVMAGNDVSFYEYCSLVDKGIVEDPCKDV